MRLTGIPQGRAACAAESQERYALFGTDGTGRERARTNPWAVGTSTAVNGGVLALVLWMGFRTITTPVPTGARSRAVDLSELAAQARLALRGGGGGGENNPIDAIMGRTPPVAKAPLATPQIPVVDHPILVLEPAIAAPPDVHLPDNPALPTIGVHTSANVRLLSGGPGGWTGIGPGTNGGDGPGNGPGYGGGDSPNGGVYTQGAAGLTAPVPLITPEAEFSDEARQQKYQGACLISIIVDANGNPRNPRVVRSLGMGLDEKAMEAVQRYRFKPGLKNGRPVPVRLTVEVNFRLF